MASEDDEAAELRLSLEQRFVVPSGNGDEDLGVSYVRRIRGRILLASAKEESEIGAVELIYFDGSRAMDAGLDIEEICDGVGRTESQYAQAVYDGGLLDRDIVGEALSNDLLAVHVLSVQAKYRGRGYGTYVVRKIVETVGYHCGAVVVKPANTKDVDFGPEEAAEEGPDYGFILDLQRTNAPTVFCVAVF